MKKWKNSIGLAALVAVLLGVIYLPVLVTAVEDDRLVSQVKNIEIEAVNMNFNETSIQEELTVIAGLLVDNIQIYSDETQDYNAEIEKLTKTYVQNFLKIVYGEDIPLFVTYRTTYNMFVDRETGEMYALRECVGTDAEGLEYVLWLDAVSGTVLAYTLPKETINWTKETFHQFAEELVAYYEYEKHVFVGEESMIDSGKNWQGFFAFGSGDESIEIEIFCAENRIWFNMYPGSVTISDAD